MIEDKDLIGKNIILYDGICGLCNKFNLFILPRDKQDKFRFASLQSQFAINVLKRFGYNASELDTIYVIANYKLPSEKIYFRAQAAIFVLEQIGGLWLCLAPFKILPNALLNCAYDQVAKVRYRLFGKYDQCPLPSDNYKEKFIDI